MISLLKISFAVAFLAHMVTLQSGPGFVFLHFRRFIGTTIAEKIAGYAVQIVDGKSHLARRANLLRSIGELFNCPFCLSVWIAFFAVAIFANENFVANWLVVCGLVYVELGVMNGAGK